MTKKIFIYSILTLLFFSSFSQTPFTTLIKEPRFLIKLPNDRYMGLKKDDAPQVKSFIDNKKIMVGNDTIQQSTKNDFDFFKSSAFSLHILNKGDNRGSISSQVLYYKLYIANPNEKNQYRINRYNIPLMLIAKLSTNYDSISTSSAVDVLDYEAAPVTLRIMPSIKASFQTYNDVFYFGFYSDIRGITLPSPTSGTSDVEFVSSSGIGFTYQGDGQAGAYNANGEYEAGRFSLSLIFEAATGKKDVISKLFATDDKYVTALQGYFVFKISDKSKLNFKIGYQHLFQKTIAGLQNNFSVAIGI